MERLLELDDFALGLLSESDPGKLDYNVRLSARAVVFNANGDVALMHASNLGYHKLPGGGFEGDEDWRTCAARETLEETGHRIVLRERELGEIVEWRAAFKLKQISYCGIADLVEESGQTPELTDEEISVGLKPMWVPLREAIALMEHDVSDDYEGKFIRLRDMTFLRRALKLCG